MSTRLSKGDLHPASAMQQIGSAHRANLRSITETRAAPARRRRDAAQGVVGGAVKEIMNWKRRGKGSQRKVTQSFWTSAENPGDGRIHDRPHLAHLHRGNCEITERG